eukprot:contig_1960_g327
MTDGDPVARYGCMQEVSRARGELRTRQQLKEMSAAFSKARNADRPEPPPLEVRLSIERRPLIVVDPSHISLMPLHLTLGITVWLLRLGIEIAYFYGGMARADVYTSELARVLRYGAGVKPVP